MKTPFSCMYIFAIIWTFTERYQNERIDGHVLGNSIQLHVYTCSFTPFSFDLKIKNEIN